MDVLLQPETIEYRALGGTLDFYFFVGNSPIQAIQNYGMSHRFRSIKFLNIKWCPVKFIGLPQMQALWTLGFHLYVICT